MEGRRGGELVGAARKEGKEGGGTSSSSDQAMRGLISAVEVRRDKRGQFGEGGTRRARKEGKKR
jgi:hypothetical protein